jgi:hypothetical protein
MVVIPMRLLYVVFILLCCSITQAHAEVKTVTQVASLLENAVRTKDIKTCRTYSTATSHPYIERIFATDLSKHLPLHITYSKPVQKGKTATLNASTHPDKFVRLLFVREAKQWKLDFPASMQSAWGDDWETQLDQMEQLYQIMQSQFGDDNTQLLEMLTK